MSVFSIPKLNIEYYEGNIYLIPLLLIFVLLIIISLILYSEGQNQTGASQDPVEQPTKPCRGERPHRHVWQAHYVSIKCGWHISSYDEPCQVKSDITWKCSICHEVRCGTHAQAHYPNNYGPTRNS